MAYIDKVGKKNNRLLVISVSDKKGYLNCICDCGKEKVVSASNFSKTGSCGCYHNEVLIMQTKTHGEGAGKRTPEYNTWASIKGRCTCVTNKKYKNYGGRGVQICDRWKNSFENFLQDMGRRPLGCNSIDRINNNGNYSPDNCRWATNNQQSNNKTTSVFMEHNGEVLTASQWSLKLGLKYSIIQQANKKGKSISDIIKQYLNESSCK